MKSIIAKMHKVLSVLIKNSRLSIVPPFLVMVEWKRLNDQRYTTNKAAKFLHFYVPRLST